jgi:hypothetical protein
MAGLVPAIHALLQGRAQIVPISIEAIHQPHLPCPRPMLDRFLSLNHQSNVIESFEVDQPLQSMLLREAVDQFVLMLVAATNEIAGDTDVQYAIAAIAHEVNKTGLHAAILSKAWMAGTSPAMTAGRPATLPLWGRDKKS